MTRIAVPSRAIRRGAGALTAVAALVAGATVATSAASAAAAVGSIQQTPVQWVAGTGQSTTYTLLVKDATGNKLSGASIAVTATETVPRLSSNPLTITDSTGATVGRRNSVGFSTTATDTVTFTTDAQGGVTFGVASTVAGTVAIHSAGGSATADSQLSVLATSGGGGTGGAPGDANVTNLNLQSSTVHGYAGTGAVFALSATDNLGKPVANATVYYEITAGADANATTETPAQFGVTSSDGQVIGSVLGSGGTTNANDTVEFWVNHTSGLGSHSTGPDSGEPTATGHAQFTSALTPANDNPTTDPSRAVSGVSISPASQVLPAGTNSVSFTANVTHVFAQNTTPPSTTGPFPYAGVVVTFHLGGALHSLATATTDGNGNATITVTPASSAAGNNVIAYATVDGTGKQSSNAAVQFQTAAPKTFTVTPTTQTVAKGSTVTLTGTVIDQFGHAVAGQVIAYSIGSGSRNAGKTATVTTGASGSATIQYTDTAASTSTATKDTITVVDQSASALGSKTAAVNYLLGSTTPASVAVSPSSLGSHVVSTGPAGEVVATVKNERGEILSGKTVVFTVSSGFVGNASVTSSSNTTTYTTTTDVNGQATAWVGGTKVGAQTVTVTVPTGTTTAVTGSTTGVYTVGAAAQLTIAPTTTSVAQSSTATFTATVTDSFGNPVANQTVAFAVTGVGTLNGTTSQSVTTGADGTATVLVGIPATANNGDAGTLTATDSAIPNATNNHATATYTVSSAAPGGAGAHQVTLTPKSGTNVGGTETVGVLLTNGTGAPVTTTTLVRYTVTGANSASGMTATNGSGKATISYPARHAGTDTITVYADSNGNGQKDTDEPSATATVKITGFEKPTLTLSSTAKHVLRIVAHTHPKLAQADVNFYSVSASGKRKLIGSALSGPGGNATFVWRGLKSGHVYKVQARVINGGTLSERYSATVSHRVK